MSTFNTYSDFLQSKVVVSEQNGFDVEPGDLNPALFPHQRDVVAWAIKGGCRAVFASFGLGKTVMQIQIIKTILEKSGGESGLIVCSLGVKAEFVRDAKRFFELDFRYVRTDAEYLEMREQGQRYFITNYERVRDSNLDPNQFAAVSLDEASILRSFGSKTYQEFLPMFKTVKYRFVCTATPAPNRFKELIHYAAFLGIMDSGQALTRWFKRNSQKAGELTIHPHKEREFWLWVSTWATFLTKPSDLGYSDEGYDLPELINRGDADKCEDWNIGGVFHHRISDSHLNAGTDSWGQGLLYRDTTLSSSKAARIRRDSLDMRVEKLLDIINTDPDGHWLIWHDLDDERDAIKKHLPGVRTVTGNMDLEEREEIIAGFSDGTVNKLSTKPSLAGSGCNFQRHCFKCIYFGTALNSKFNDFIQSIHRIHRFLQTKPVQVHLIYTSSEDKNIDDLFKKWKQHRHLVKQMTGIIRQYGLTLDMQREMSRSIGITRREVKGNRFTAVNNDNVLETARMKDDSVDLIVTSWPFGNHYEYSASYNDFGHNENDDRFFEQMDFLTREEIRILKPGRMYCLHVKDRLLYGSVTGLGMYSVNPFSDKCVSHMIKHGFTYQGRITIDTDVVRENSQTYRLGWSENGKDGTKMGIGSPEYILLFRKLPSDLSNAYADEPVFHSRTGYRFDCHVCGAVSDNLPDRKTGKTDFMEVNNNGHSFIKCTKCGSDGAEKVESDYYSRSRWQLDASSIWRSGGNRFLTPEKIQSLEPDALKSLWRQFANSHVYDYEEHVTVLEEREKRGLVPTGFMLLQPHCGNEEWIWEDITRMLTLNTEQVDKKKEAHICPLQFDVVERLIRRYSNEGELVLDPFGGLMTVPYCALKMNRKGYGIELNPDYFDDGVFYLKAIEYKKSVQTLFDLLTLPENEPETRK